MLLAVMSHEIRSPMNAILASIELLQKNDLPAETRRLIRLASGSAENLLRLLNDVLDISKIEAGGLELDLAPVDIAELVVTCRSEEHTSELQSLMRTSYAVFCLKKKKSKTITNKLLIEQQTHT